MSHAFLNSNLGCSQVLKSSDRERKSWVLLVDNREERPGALALEVILHVHFSLVHGSPNISFSAHTVTGGNHNIETEDISWSEFPIFNSLLWGLLVNNALICVNKMLLELMGENTLTWSDLIGLANLLDLGSHVLVGGTNLNGSSGSLESLMSCEDAISLLTLGLVTDNKGMGGEGGVTINMTAELDLDDIFSLKLDALITAWREVCHNLIN